MIQINGIYPKDEQYLEIIRDVGLVKEISNAAPGKVLDSTEASKKRIRRNESSLLIVSERRMLLPLPMTEKMSLLKNLPHT